MIFGIALAILTDSFHLPQPALARGFGLEHTGNCLPDQFRHGFAFPLRAGAKGFMLPWLE